LSYQGDLREDELKILRHLSQNAGARLTAAEIAPRVGLSLNQTTDYLNELEWVGYVEEHEGEGAESAFSLTADGVQAASA
jgi:DNA-binding IclR family transcriptional regulator